MFNGNCIVWSGMSSDRAYTLSSYIFLIAHLYISDSVLLTCVIFMMDYSEKAKYICRELSGRLGMANKLHNPVIQIF